MPNTSSGERDDGITHGLLRHKPTNTTYHVELEREENGRWLAEITEVPGVMAYGRTEKEAMGRALSLALRVQADRLEHGEEIDSDTEHSFYFQHA